MKILITGSAGMLGQELLGFLSKNHEIIAGNRDFFDITNESQMQNFFEKNFIDLLINTAAYTDVRGAEMAGNKQKSPNFQANAMALKYLANFSKKYNFFLMHISTDYVFDGEKKSEYLPLDAKNPINYYGLAKSVGEDFILKNAKKFCIIRTSWLYNADKNGNHFIGKIFQKIQNNEKCFVICDNFGRPTLAKDLAHAIFQICENEKILKNFSGKILHLTNSGKKTSWYEVAWNIAKFYQKEGLIEAVSYKNFSDIVKRPENSCLKNESEIQLPDWKTSLQKTLKNF